MTIIVTVTYVWLVMQADNDGEGGIMALITLIRRRGVPGSRRAKIALGDPSTTRSPFFLLAPEWARLPMVFLAAVATVIASQAVITGAFSVAHQAARIGYLPRLRVSYTSEETMGQIYVPWINWLLMVGVLTLVITFKSSAALAYAFGMAVTGTITITTLLFFYVVRYQWRKPWWIVAPGAAVLLTVDLLFFAANLTKLVSGAWLPLLIAIVAFTILTTWQRGRELVTRQRQRDEGQLRAFIDHLHAMKPPLHRVPGTSVFLNRGKDTAPLALRANVEHNQVSTSMSSSSPSRPCPCRTSRPPSGSWRPHRSPPTPPNTSSTPATVPSSWAHASSCSSLAWGPTGPWAAMPPGHLAG